MATKTSHEGFLARHVPGRTGRAGILAIRREFRAILFEQHDIGGRPAGMLSRPMTPWGAAWVALRIIHRDDVMVDVRGFHDTEATSGPH